MKIKEEIERSPFTGVTNAVCFIRPHNKYNKTNLWGMIMPDKKKICDRCEIELKYLGKIDKHISLCGCPKCKIVYFNEGI